MHPNLEVQPFRCCIRFFTSFRLCSIIRVHCAVCWWYDRSF